LCHDTKGGGSDEHDEAESSTPAITLLKTIRYSTAT